jgi:hypothetical protein
MGVHHAFAIAHDDYQASLDHLRARGVEITFQEDRREAGEQPLERGAARFSVPAWIPRSRAPTGYYVSTANRRFSEP